MQKKIYWSWAFKQIQMLGVMFGWGVNFFLEKVQFSSCHLNSRTPVHTLLHIWKKICAHLAKDLLGILQFAFMPRRADNDAGPRVFGGNLWLQGRNTGLLQKQLLQSQKQIYCFQVYFHPQDWQHNMWGLIPWWSRGCLQFQWKIERCIIGQHYAWNIFGSKNCQNIEFESKLVLSRNPLRVLAPSTQYWVIMMNSISCYHNTFRFSLCLAVPSLPKRVLYVYILLLFNLKYQSYFAKTVSYAPLLVF